VTGVHKAVTVIGVKKIRQLVLSAAIMDNFKQLPHDRLTRFWENSMRVAQWSKELSAFAGKPEIDEFFLAGFLHNIGELILLQHFPAEIKLIDLKIKEDLPAQIAEVKVLGCDHADVGSYLLSLWQLSPPAVQAAMLHHQSRMNLQQMSGITPEAKVVNMAVAISAGAGEADPFREGMNLGQIAQDYRSIIAIEHGKVTAMRERVEKTVSDLMRWFVG